MFVVYTVQYVRVGNLINSQANIRLVVIYISTIDHMTRISMREEVDVLNNGANKKPLQ